MESRFIDIDEGVPMPRWYLLFAIFYPAIFLGLWGVFHSALIAFAVWIAVLLLIAGLAAWESTDAEKGVGMDQSNTNLQSGPTR